MDDIENVKRTLEENENIIKIYCQSLKSFNSRILKLFARQLLLLKKCDKEKHANLFIKYPDLSVWLKLLNLSQADLSIFADKNVTFCDLFYIKSESDFKVFLEKKGIVLGDNQRNLISSSFNSLKKIYKNSDSEGRKNCEDIEPSRIDDNEANKSLNHRKSVSEGIGVNNLRLSVITSNEVVSNFNQATYIENPQGSSSQVSSGKRNIKTPPPIRKNSTTPKKPTLTTASMTKPASGQINNNDNFLHSLSANPNMQRSTSHESHLRNKINNNIEQFPVSLISANEIAKINSIAGTQEDARYLTSRGRYMDKSIENMLSAEGSENSSACPSEAASPCILSPNPENVFNMFFSKDEIRNNYPNKNVLMEHRWSNTFKMANCTVCNKKMILGLRCKKCKSSCHKECEKKCVTFCGGTKKNIERYSPNNKHNRIIVSNDPNKIPITAVQYPKPSASVPAAETSSSCNSSESNSPLVVCNKKTPPSPALTNSLLKGQADYFKYEKNETDKNRYDSDKDNLFSNTNMYGESADINDQESTQSSDNLKENPIFNISYDEISEKIELGKGRFGIVYKAYWHGQIAIKEIEFEECLSEDVSEIKSFNEEVSNLRKTRHNNLILYYGACIKPNKCAIVMTLCRGISLYKTIHCESFSKITFDWIINIAIQIAQGMAYLHNKQMIHKDLRSKNVFIDGHKAVISDFGLYSITSLNKSLRRRNNLQITKECLYYMAPELIRSIGSNKMDNIFSKLSDVYSFGTICYEMFCYDFPFSSYHTDTILYMIGNSLKSLPPIIQIPREFKVILLNCWAKEITNRPSFSQLLETFRSIPKKNKKLFRSPSHPLGLGKSF